MPDPWYERIRLPSPAAEAIRRDGFVILPGPDLGNTAAAYDAAMANGAAPDLRIGNTTTRLSDLVSRSAVFDTIFLHPPLLEVCAHFLGGPFKLSSLLARTLHPHAPEQALHQDLPDDSTDGPMLGFIFTVDPFRAENGATRFVPPGSREEVDACAPAGSLIVFHASIPHGHGANRTVRPRRSIQGYFIRREVPSACDFAARMTGATRGTLSPFARYLLALEDAPM